MDNNSTVLDKNEKRNIKKQNRRNRKNNIFRLIVVLVVLMVTIIAIIFITKYVLNKINTPKYTWEEYVELSPEEQDKFKNKFSTEEEFYEWLTSNVEDISLQPWEEEGRNPADYSYSEYEKLFKDEQEKFREYFKSEEEFDLWKDNSKGIEKPWESEGKDPSAYSWEEFEKLTAKQQEAFFASFETSEELEKWLEEIAYE